MLNFELNKEKNMYEAKFVQEDTEYIIQMELYENDLDLIYNGKPICMLAHNKKKGKLTVDAKKQGEKEIQDFLERHLLTGTNALEILSGVNYTLTQIKRTFDSVQSDDNTISGIGDRLRKQPSNTELLVELAGLMEDSFDIIRTRDGKYYYFNQKFGYYEEVDYLLYGYLVKQKYRVNLPAKSCDTSLTSIIGIEEDNINLWEFADKMYLEAISPKNYRVVKKDNPQLTSRKFIHNKQLLNYRPDVELNNGANATLMEKTLRELFIPRQEPENDKAFKDILYLIGEAFIINNVSKNLVTLYNPQGNNGKTLFAFILECLFGKKYEGIEPKDFKDPFFKTLIDDKNVILIDEILPESLMNHYHQLKNITKGGSNSEGLRKMYKDEYQDSKGNGVFFILCNELLDINLDDTALLHRFLVYDLPNLFIENVDESKNEYEINPSIFDEIKEDREGLEWLVNISIKMYLNYNFERQTVDEVKNKFIQENVIRRFIVEETVLYNKPKELSDSAYMEKALSTLEIRDILIGRYSYLENWDLQRLLSRIGKEVTRHYGADVKRISDKPTTYNIKYVKKPYSLK